MIRKKVAHHFLPHFLVDPSYAEEGPFKHDDIHHRAHGLSLVSLFVYFQLLVFLTAGLYFLKANPQILGTVSFSAEQIIELTNKKRVENGLGPLSSNGLLAAAAAGKAADMLANDYWAHNSPQGKTPWVFISGAGYRYIFAGENLARDFDNAGGVVEAWMNSPSHRSNVLDKNFKEIGVAVTSGKLDGREGSLVVQMFGTSVAAPVVAAKPVEVSKPAPAAATPKTEVVASPTSLPQSPEPSVILNPTAAIIEGEPDLSMVLASRKFSIEKTASFIFVAFIFALFALEAMVTLKRNKVNLRPGVLAHLLLLAFVLFAVWYTTGGAII